MAISTLGPSHLVVATTERGGSGPKDSVVSFPTFGSVLFHLLSVGALISYSPVSRPVPRPSIPGVDLSVDTTTLRPPVESRSGTTTTRVLLSGVDWFVRVHQSPLRPTGGTEGCKI